MITFNWIITSTDLFSNSDFIISSDNNPFALSFTNANMQLIDIGLETEAYTFSVPMDKIVMPQTALTPDNAATGCIYNDTAFEARLYTKMRSTYPTNAEAVNPSAQGPVFKPWPNAVKVMQVIDGGQNVPMCFRTTNGLLGQRVTEGLEAQPSTSTCTCEYMNFGND
jgi:hypothetical protein